MGRPRRAPWRAMPTGTRLSALPGCGARGNPNRAYRRYTAIPLIDYAMTLKFDLVHPGTGSTALLANHIPGFGSERAPGAPTPLPTILKGEILEAKARLQELERPTKKPEIDYTYT